MPWRYESDGGDWYEGNVQRRGMRTHYLVRCEELQRVDCRSKNEACRLLNRQRAGDWDTPEEAEAVLRKIRGLDPEDSDE